MTLKNTILISAVTYFFLNFIIWAVGWMIWPIVWAVSGIAILKLGDYLEGCDHEKDPGWLKALAALMGPVGIIPFICAAKEGVFDFGKLNLPSFPSIRNPFIWPEKEIDKQENKD